jgi:hypothetical protein
LENERYSRIKPCNKFFHISGGITLSDELMLKCLITEDEFINKARPLLSFGEENER